MPNSIRILWRVTTATSMVLLILLSTPAPSRAQCSDECTLVMLFSGISPYPSTHVSLDLCHVAVVGTLTYPTDEDLLAAVEAVYVNDPEHDIYRHHRVATAGPFHLYLAGAADFGAATIVDGRTGQVVFGGRVIWMGDGSVAIPSASSESCLVDSESPAALPTTSSILPNIYWTPQAGLPGGSGTQEELMEQALTIARQTDLLRNMSLCGDYSVVGYTYTPSVGETDPRVALEVLVLSGLSDGSTPVQSSTWGRIKSLYGSRRR